MMQFPIPLLKSSTVQHTSICFCPVSYSLTMQGCIHAKVLSSLRSFTLKQYHRHLRIIAHTACLVCLISTVNGHSKKERKKGYKCGASSGQITNLEQSFHSFDIYDQCRMTGPVKMYMVISVF